MTTHYKTSVLPIFKTDTQYTQRLCCYMSHVKDSWYTSSYDFFLYPYLFIFTRGKVRFIGSKHVLYMRIVR